MKLLLDIRDSRSEFFLELIRSFSFVTIMEEIKEKKKAEALSNLAEAIRNVEANEKGEKKLKKAPDFLNEI